MKALQQLIQPLQVLHIAGSTAVEVSALCLDSRKTTKGCLFFAVKGTLTDGHRFIDQVVAEGAVAVICEQLPAHPVPHVSYVQVASVAPVVGLVASVFFDQPTRRLQIVGVTGTNGKTTVATLLYRLFQSLGFTTGLVSTVQNQIGETSVPATHTTPDPISLQQLFRQMADAGCTYAFMEVSSHAIHQHRIAGVAFAGGVFTNITHDHLDYHKTFDAYISAKKAFFDALPQSAFALANADDKRGLVMLQNTAALKKTFGLRLPADFKGKVLDNDLDGLQMLVNRQEVHFRLNGLFNAYNLLAVYGAAELLGQDKIEVLAILSNLRGAPGRFETYRSAHTGVLGIIDYAHTPDALLNVLATIKQFSNNREILTVVGCGGDRDKTKRPLMAQVACEHSHKVILTSDNPRSEEPEVIVAEMEAGLSYAQKRKILKILDRKEAIKTACTLAKEGDVVLVAGKGHEHYQEIKGVKHHFDDKEVLLEVFALLDI